MSPKMLRKFLAIVDDTPECRPAIRFAAVRAARTGGGVTLMRVLEPGEFQHWATVEDLMRDEAREAAEELLQEIGREILQMVDLYPEFVIREGNVADEILKVLSEDRSISVLTLGAATGEEGPGPLVSSFTGKLVGKVSVPLAIVPGNLSPEEIDEVA